jgi:excisionase family DNA binding protein
MKIKNIDYMTIKEVSEFVGVSIGTVYYWVKTRKFSKLISYKNKIYIEKKEVDSFYKDYSKVIPL